MTCPSFTWRLHTRDNLAVANGMNAEVQIFDAPHRQGYGLTAAQVTPAAYQEMLSVSWG